MFWAYGTAWTRSVSSGCTSVPRLCSLCCIRLLTVKCSLRRTTRFTGTTAWTATFSIAGRPCLRPVHLLAGWFSWQLSGELEKGLQLSRATSWTCRHQALPWPGTRRSCWATVRCGYCCVHGTGPGGSLGGSLVCGPPEPQVHRVLSRPHREDWCPAKWAGYSRAWVGPAGC